MNHGVPQCSTLGPILFAMYVAPLEQVVLDSGARCHQYADDTQLYIRLTPGPDTLGDLGKCADCVARWFLLNGLMVNPSKTGTICLVLQVCLVLKEPLALIQNLSLRELRFPLLSQSVSLG